MAIWRSGFCLDERHEGVTVARSLKWQLMRVLWDASSSRESGGFLSAASGGGRSRSVDGSYCTVKGGLNPFS